MHRPSGPWTFRRAAKYLTRALVLVAVVLVGVATAGRATAQQVDCRAGNDDVGDLCADLQFAGDITGSVEGATISFSVPVVNLGAVDSTETQVSATGQRLPTGSATLPPLAPQQPVTVVITSQIPDDASGETERVEFVLDPSGRVPEESEENNSTFFSVVLPEVAQPTTDTTTTETQTQTTETTTQPDTETTETETTPTTSDDDSFFDTGTLVWVAVIGGGVLLLGGAALALRARRSSRGPQAPPRAPLPAPSEARSAPAAKPPIVLEELGAPSAPEEPESAPARFVNTGFSSTEDPGTPFDPSTPLRPSTVYHFWLEIGEIVGGSIETTPTELTEIEELPPESRLKVVLFHVAGGPEDPRVAESGELTIAKDGSVVVSEQPPFAPDLGVDSELRKRRLFFFAETGNARTLQLRCSIYHKQVLLQSRLITARVSGLAEHIEDALMSELDFTLAPRLDSRHLNSIPEYTLSLLLNQAGDGTHSLTVNGKNFSDSASFDVDELQELVERGRRTLRRAAWGTETAWKEGEEYRYLTPTRAMLQTDLVSLALWGIRFYDRVCDQLAGDKSYEELEASMTAPGYVQLAVKKSPRHLLPAAVIYDYIGLEDVARDYSLCPEFLKALDAQPPLGESPCFKGECPSRGSATTVCPSGFWGFRHALGIPVTLDGAPDVPATITYTGQPALSLSVCTDPAFTLRAAHEEVLRGLRPDLSYAATRTDALALLKEGRTHVAYFYCHGGLENDVPFLKVGPLTDLPITSVTLRNERIQWKEPRPLVFLNGCHTTGLEPEQALELVSSLVRRAAAGVVGTEITVFEPLARTFAEDCLRRFLGGTPLGWAVRDARLALLKAGNPLGLVYLPYALPSLELVAE